MLDERQAKRDEYKWCRREGQREKYIQRNVYREIYTRKEKGVKN